MMILNTLKLTFKQKRSKSKEKKIKTKSKNITKLEAFCFNQAFHCIENSLKI